MIELIALVLNDPEKIFPYPQYPAGVVDEQQGIYRFAYPNTENPVAQIPYVISDKEGNYILPGFYEVALTIDRSTLLLIQSNKVKARIPVVKIEEKEINQYEENEKACEEAKKRALSKKTNATDMTEAKKQVKLKAKIMISKSGHYILEYSNGYIKAWGYFSF